MKIVIAGASGFIGKRLLQPLAKSHRVIALSRRGPANSIENISSQPGVTFVRANLFSLIEVEKALAGADIGIYLVHSMMPPSRLTQGTFADIDVILADNFARAAKTQNLKKIIYLGGLIPSGQLSPHLASRLEVEEILQSRATPVIALRAGLIVGRKGSSFLIMKKLVGRLPIMICPSWTYEKCQPIDIEDVVKIISATVADQALAPGAYDIGGPDKLSYVEMMRHTAAALGLQRTFLRVPVVSPRLSRLWVSTVTSTSKALVYPLVESLRHSMLARDLKLQERYGIKPMSFDDAIRDAVTEPHGKSDNEESSSPVVSNTPVMHAKNIRESSTVMSVQRLPLPAGHSVTWVAQEYARWLPSTLYPFIHVHLAADSSLQLRLLPIGKWGPSVVLMDLRFSASRSSKTRQLFYIEGGALLSRAPSKTRGRLEFRLLPDGKHVMAAVLDYRPRLPWWIYTITQAQVHLLVMALFRRHLYNLSRVRTLHKVERAE